MTAMRLLTRTFALAITLLPLAAAAAPRERPR